MNDENQDPFVHVLLWDKTPTDEGSVMIKNIYDLEFLTTVPIVAKSGFATIELNKTTFGEPIPRRPGATKIFVLLYSEEQDIDVNKIYRTMIGIFQLNFKNSI